MLNPPKRNHPLEHIGVPQTRIAEALRVTQPAVCHYLAGRRRGAEPVRYLIDLWTRLALMSPAIARAAITSPPCRTPWSTIEDFFLCRPLEQIHRVIGWDGRSYRALDMLASTLALVAAVLPCERERLIGELDSRERLERLTTESRMQRAREVTRAREEAAEAKRLAREKRDAGKVKKGF